MVSYVWFNMNLLCHEKAERPCVQTDDLKRIINHNEKLTTPYATRLSKLALGHFRVKNDNVVMPCCHSSMML